MIVAHSFDMPGLPLDQADPDDLATVMTFMPPGCTLRGFTQIAGKWIVSFYTSDGKVMQTEHPI